MSQVTFADGSASALAGPDLVVLVQATGAEPVLGALRQAMEAQPTFDAMVDALVALGPTSLPALAVIADEPGGIRAIARNATISVNGPSGTTASRPRGEATWTEIVVTGGQRASATLDGPGPASATEISRPLAAGAVADASAVQLVAGAAPPPGPAPAGDPAATLLPDDLPDLLAAVKPLPPLPGAAPTADAPPVDTPVPASPKQLPQVIGAPPVVAQPGPAPTFVPVGAAPPAGPLPAPTHAEPAPHSATTDDGESDVDESTIGIAEFRARQATASGLGEGERTVPGIVCPAGHANPPYAGSCRLCGASIIDRIERAVVRPSLGHLAFDDGLVVEVSGPILLGRKPTAETIDGEPAQLVAIDDPDRLLSRTHAEIRLDGWRVQVVDRASRNHTVVEPPSRAAVQLEAHVPCPVVPGTTIRLGDAVRCRFVVVRPAQ